jgi:hypothetical protein
MAFISSIPSSNISVDTRGSFEEFQENVQQILDGIPREEILATLRKLKASLQNVIIIDREYI